MAHANFGRNKQYFLRDPWQMVPFGVWNGFDDLFPSGWMIDRGDTNSEARVQAKRVHAARPTPRCFSKRTSFTLNVQHHETMTPPWFSKDRPRRVAFGMVSPRSRHAFRSPSQRREPGEVLEGNTCGPPGLWEAKGNT